MLHVFNNAFAALEMSSLTGGGGVTTSIVAEIKVYY